jgi:hypothetical protein
VDYDEKESEHEDVQEVEDEVEEEHEEENVGEEEHGDLVEEEMEEDPEEHEGEEEDEHAGEEVEHAEMDDVEEEYEHHVGYPHGLKEALKEKLKHYGVENVKDLTLVEEIIAQVKTLFIDGLPASWDEDIIKERILIQTSSVIVFLALSSWAAPRCAIGKGTES